MACSVGAHLDPVHACLRISPVSSTHGNVRIGIGFDAHKLVNGRPLILGGITIPFDRGLAGHSDGDVLLHALMDALLGAAALPDIGTRFPDTDPAYRDANSALLLDEVMASIREQGYNVVNTDLIVVCDRPKLAEHAAAIRAGIAARLGVAETDVGFKAKTTEGTALAIADRSIAALATVLLTTDS